MEQSNHFIVSGQGKSIEYSHKGKHNPHPPIPTEKAEKKTFNKLIHAINFFANFFFVFPSKWGNFSFLLF